MLASIATNPLGESTTHNFTVAGLKSYIGQPDTEFEDRN